MYILYNSFWVYYLQNKKIKFDSDKSGKWMYFFDDIDFASSICKKAVESGVEQEAKHTNGENGVSCFYMEYDDVKSHKRTIAFMLENNLIKKTKSGKLYNLSFKLDNQTRAGQYGSDFKSEIKLSNFIDLYTGEWKWKR